MTIDEKKQDLLDKRKNSLSSIIALDQTEDNAIEERDFNWQYLFGDGVDEGVFDYISVYYQEMYLSVGRTCLRPDLRLNDNDTWNSKCEAAVQTEGDDDYPLGTTNSYSLYPEESSGVATDTLNTSSPWLTNNSDQGETTGGIVGLCNTLIDTRIGEEAEQGTGRETEDYGVGLWGQRTADNDALATTPITYGDGSADYPDYYDSTYKSSFENDLNTLSTNIASLITKNESIKSLLQKIVNHENNLFIESGIEDDVPTSDISALTIYIASLSDYKEDVDTFYTYFSQFSASNNISGQTGYSRSTFNTYLYTDLPTLLNNIISLLQARANYITNNNLLGTISTGLKKWRYFWVNENIQKPLSPYVVLNGVSIGKTSANKQLNESNNSLDILVEDVNQYISQPTLYAVYNNPILNNETSQIEIRRVTLIWQGEIFCNRYKIYRKEYTISSIFNTTPTNDNWEETYFYQNFYEVDEDTNIILTEFNDTSIEVDKVYVYRIQVLDTNIAPYSHERIDSFNSASLQSEVYQVGSEIDGVLIDNIIKFSENIDFQEEDWITIIGDENSFFERIVSISNRTITLTNTHTNQNVKVYTTKSIIQII